MTDISNMSITFDLDGTLVDTAPDLIRVLNIVIAKGGLPQTDYAAARKTIEHGSMAMIKQAYALANTEVSETRALEIQKNFFKIYTDGLAQCSKPFPGVIDVLNNLKHKGARLSVCTNKPGYMARPLLKQLGMSHFFENVIGSSDGVRHKPSADHIFAAVGHRKERPIIMVGDGRTDVRAAKAAKVPVILVSYGYSKQCVHTFGADAVLRSFRELPSALRYV